MGGEPEITTSVQNGIAQTFTMIATPICWGPSDSPFFGFLLFILGWIIIVAGYVQRVSIEPITQNETSAL